MPRKKPQSLEEQIDQYRADKAAGKFKKEVRERNVESHLVDRVADLGGTAFKFVSPGFNGVPDRLVLLPVAPEHRELVARYVRLPELKRAGKTPRPEQISAHRHLRALGYQVDVIDTKAQVDELFPNLFA